MEDNKFKSDPYNLKNVLLTENDILNILKKLNIQNIKITNLDLYQTAFVHKSYCKMKDYEEYSNDIDVTIKIINGKGNWMPSPIPITIIEPKLVPATIKGINKLST